MMKQGIIVYLLGGGEMPAGLNPGAHYPGLSNPRGPMEIVVSRPGILELDDAWHFLLTLGCDPIHLLVARADDDRLQPLYPLVRLTDIARVQESPYETGSERRALH
jgi:hypothetical protein